eukprot:jgi/Bigna1/86157/estExt_fgenesh1_pg.C_80205
MPWRRSRVMFVGKGHTGKTTLHMALKGEEFRVTESTVVADVTVQDVTAATVSDAKHRGKFIKRPVSVFHGLLQFFFRKVERPYDSFQNTVFKNVTFGGNYERALVLAHLKKKCEDEKNTKVGEKQEEKEKVKEEAIDPKVPLLSQYPFKNKDEKTGKPSTEINAKGTEIVSSSSSDDNAATTNKQIAAEEGKLSLSSPKQSADVKDSGNGTDEDIKESKGIQGESLNEEKLIKELDPGRMQESLDNPEAIRVSVWDFAGQEVFYTSHVIFLNRNCLYMVVFSLEEFLGREKSHGETAAKQQRDAEEYLRFWLQNIRTFAPGAPIVLVGTKIDKLKEFKEPEELLKTLNDVDRKVTRIAREVFEGFNPFPWFRSSNGEVHSTIMELRNEVMERLKNDEKVNEEVPSAWTKVCDDLISKEQAIFTLQAVQEECREHGIVDEREVRWMLRKFVDEGVIIHEAVLRHLWRCPKPLLTEEGHDEDSKVTAEELEKMRLYEYGRNILEKFMILCKIGGTDKYLVPSMMKDSTSRERKEYKVMGKFSLRFKRLRPHSYHDILVGSIVSELSSNTERTKRLRKEGMTVPFKLEQQVFVRGEAELYLEPVHFRVSTTMLQRKKGRRGRSRRVMSVDIEILSETEDCARILQFILEIANGIHTWPYQDSEAAEFDVILFNRTMTHTVDYDNWRKACENKLTRIVSKTNSRNVEMADFRSWEPFYELFSKHRILRYTFDICEPSSGDDSKRLIQLKTVMKHIEQLYPSESAQCRSKRMKSLPTSATKRGGITFEEYVELMWVERGPQLREAKNASNFDAKVEAWVRPLTSDEIQCRWSKLHFDNDIEVPAHLAFVFALPLNNMHSILQLEKDGEMMEDMSKAVSVNSGCGADNEDCQLHMSRWRASKENMKRALRSDCFAMLVGCHGEHGLQFENDVPQGKAVYVKSVEFAKMIMEAKKTPTCSLKILMLAACKSEAVAQVLVRLKAVDHIIVCSEEELLGDKAVRIFQTVFFERLLGGDAVLTSFEAAKQQLKDMASTFTKQSKGHETHTSQHKELLRKAKRLNEEVKKYLLLPKDGNHDVRFSFKPYSPPPAKLKSWLPALPQYFHPAPFLKQLKWAVDHYLQLQRNLFTAVQRDQENSTRHRWVQLTGPSKVGKTSAAKYVAWRLKRYDVEGPDGIFWVSGGKSRNEVVQNLMNLPDMKYLYTEKAGKLDPYERIKRFFLTISDRPVLMIIDGADEVKIEDREKLFTDLMDLSPRLHILTTSTKPIQLQGFDSNKEDLMLNVWHWRLFEKFFKMRAYAFKDSNFEKLIEDGIQHKYFTKLYASKHFKESNKYKNPQTAFLLLQKMHKKCIDINDARRVIRNKPYYLVDLLNELLMTTRRFVDDVKN